MAGYKSNSKQFIKNIEKFLPGQEKKLATRMRRIARFAHPALIKKTAVYTGKTVRNYRVQIDRPSDAEFPALGTGAPGMTNAMALGREPRRAINKADSLTTLDRISKITPEDPYHEIWISNATPTIGLQELGLLPDEGRSRAKGMFRMTMAEVLNKMQAGAL